MVTHPSSCSGFKNYKNTNSFCFIALNSCNRSSWFQEDASHLLRCPKCDDRSNVSAAYISLNIAPSLRTDCRFVPGSQRSDQTDVVVMDSFLRVVLAR